MVEHPLGTALLCAALLCAAAAPAAAEHRSTVEMELFAVSARQAGGSWAGLGTGSATYSLAQRGNRNVRSELELTAALSPTPGGMPDASLDIGTAYAKFRFSDLRATLGKAPFSWGEGLVFNVADTMFSTGTGTDLMQSDFEDTNAWLASLSWFPGPFTFLELTAVPAPLRPVYGEEGQELAGYSLPAAEDVRVGLRAVGKLWGIKTEAGYLYDGRDGVGTDGYGGGDVYATAAVNSGGYYHRPYLSLQGNLVVDWHLSASVELPDTGNAWENAEQGLLFSGGLYSLLPVGTDDTVGFRLESLLRPSASWRQTQWAGPYTYALSHYGELTYDFGTGLSLALRSLFNPIDLSARISPGVSWNVYEGFTLLGYATVQTGEAGDSYPWEPGSAEAAEAGEAGTAAYGSTPASGGMSGLAVMIGCSVVY